MKGATCDLCQRFTLLDNSYSGSTNGYFCKDCGNDLALSEGENKMNDYRETVIKRILDLNLSYEQSYYLIIGDYASKGSTRVLMSYVESGDIEHTLIVSLLKIAPIELV